MNIKNIKALKEKNVYPEYFHASNYIVEDLPKDQRGRCMPYNSYPIPSVEDLCVMLTDYAGEDAVAVKIDASMTMMGFMMYNVTVKRKGNDGMYDSEFDSPFLDDALAEALLTLKKDKVSWNEMVDSTAHCYASDRVPDGDCTFSDNDHENHPKG